MIFKRNKKRKEFTFQSTTDTPLSIEKNVIYIIGEKRYKWLAVLICPCGCSDQIQLNLLQEGNPCWKVIKHWDKSVSIFPSIWRTIGCKSHFTIRKGTVSWVQEFY
jgi:hypothetical protein